MKRTILLGVLLALLGSNRAAAGDLARAYFEATQPGSWARYETSTSGGGKHAATYTRLADDDGGFVFEVVTEFLEGHAAGQTSASIFTLATDFDWARRFLSFGKALTGTTFVMEGRPPMPQPRHMVEAMRESMAEYDGGFEAAGKSTFGGVGCDLYAYEAVLGGPNPGTIGGEMCLSAAVPFGQVHVKATSRQEKSGESSFETRLVDSGSGAVRRAPAEASAPAPKPQAQGPQRMNIALAYQRGAIALDFRVPDDSRGRVLQVAITNLGSEPVVIGVGTSTYAFEVGLPIGLLLFQPVTEQDFELAPGETSGEFKATQEAGRGARKGSFRLVMKRGVPTVSGKVSVGKIK